MDLSIEREDGKSTMVILVLENEIIHIARLCGSLIDGLMRKRCRFIDCIHIGIWNTRDWESQRINYQRVVNIPRKSSSRYHKFGPSGIISQRVRPSPPHGANAGLANLVQIFLNDYCNQFFLQPLMIIFIGVGPFFRPPVVSLQ